MFFGGILRYFPSIILDIQIYITIVLLFGFALFVIHEIKMKYPSIKVTEESIEAFMKYVYVLAFYISQLNMLITIIMVRKFGSEVELNVFKKLVFDVFGSLSYVAIGEILISASIFLFFYYLPRIRLIVSWDRRGIGIFAI